MIQLKAYAKVNLCLKVYKEKIYHKHKIDSIFCLHKNLFDVIQIKKAKKLVVNYFFKKKKIAINDCLIKKTFLYLSKKYLWSCNYNVIVKKNIPFHSGLGGESTDAAAIFKFFLTKQPSVKLDWLDIASKLGSDIPFFLSNYSLARVEGIGQSVKELKIFFPKYKLQILPYSVVTQKVFSLLDQDKNYSSQVNIKKIINFYLNKNKLSKELIFNDLTKYIIKTSKELDKIHQTFPNNTFFTGSGGSIVILEK